MTSRSTLVAASLVCSVIAACSSASTPVPTGDAMSMDSDMTDSMPASESGAETSMPDTGMPAETSAPAPMAPTLVRVEPMMGALHVLWTNNDPTCESFEGERKTASVPYKVVFTVPGEADNKHDTTATANEDFTYRVRCKKGAMYSIYSNEMTGNPMK